MAGLRLSANRLQCLSRSHLIKAVMVYKVNSKEVLNELFELVEGDEFEETANVILPTAPVTKYLYVFTSTSIPNLDSIFTGSLITEHAIPLDLHGVKDGYVQQMEYIFRRNQISHKQVAVIANPKASAITMLLLALPVDAIVCKLYSAKDVVDLAVLANTIIAAETGAEAAIEADCDSGQAPMFLKHYKGATKTAERLYGNLNKSFSNIHATYTAIKKDAFTRFIKQFKVNR